MCELEGFMYVAGGAESWNCLNSVERYNPENNTWTLVAPMNVARRGAGIAVHAGEPAREQKMAFLFVVAGQVFTGTVNCVSVQANCLLSAVSMAPTPSAAWKCTTPPATNGGCWAA